MGIEMAWVGKGRERKGPVKCGSHMRWVRRPLVRILSAGVEMASGKGWGREDMTFQAKATLNQRGFVGHASGARLVGVEICGAILIVLEPLLEDYRDAQQLREHTHTAVAEDIQFSAPMSSGSYCL